MNAKIRLNDRSIVFDKISKMFTWDKYKFFIHKGPIPIRNYWVVSEFVTGFKIGLFKGTLKSIEGQAKEFLNMKTKGIDFDLIHRDAVDRWGVLNKKRSD